MNASEQAAVREVIAQVDVAMFWLETEIAHLDRALAAGVSLETIGAINAAILKVKANG